MADTTLSATVTKWYNQSESNIASQLTPYYEYQMNTTDSGERTQYANELYLDAIKCLMIFGILQLLIYASLTIVAVAMAKDTRDGGPYAKTDYFYNAGLCFTGTSILIHVAGLIWYLVEIPGSRKWLSLVGALCVAASALFFLVCQYKCTLGMVNIVILASIATGSHGLPTYFSSSTHSTGTNCFYIVATACAMISSVLLPFSSVENISTTHSFHIHAWTTLLVLCCGIWVGFCIGGSFGMVSDLLPPWVNYDIYVLLVASYIVHPVLYASMLVFSVKNIEKNVQRCMELMQGGASLLFVLSQLSLLVRLCYLATSQPLDASRDWVMKPWTPWCIALNVIVFATVQKLHSTIKNSKHNNSTCTSILLGAMCVTLAALSLVVWHFKPFNGEADTETFVFITQIVTSTPKDNGSVYASFSYVWVNFIAYLTIIPFYVISGIVIKPVNAKNSKNVDGYALLGGEGKVLAANRASSSMYNYLQEKETTASSLFKGRQRPTY